MFRKSISIVLVMLACITSFIAGRITGSQQPEVIPTVQVEETSTARAESPSGQSLILTVTRDMNAGTTSLYSQGLMSIEYAYLSEVNIQLNGSVLSLAEAVDSGLVSFNKLVAWAKLDADEGYCTVSATSQNGQTKFLYRYGDYELVIFDDIYETPDSSQHYIQKCTIFPRDMGVKGYSLPTTDTGKPLDLEDWGITTNVTEVTSTGITFQITQSGGQQIGSLRTYMIYLTSLAEKKQILHDIIEIDIHMDGTTSITWNWEENCGALPSGTYLLDFTVTDVYDESQVHPLMQNYHDVQAYGFYFEIP